jgi:hypothetical protein
VSTGPSWLAPALPLARPVLAQADLQKDQQHGTAKPKRQQRDGEHLAGQAADQRGAQRTGNDEGRGRPIRQDAGPWSHAPKLARLTAVRALLRHRA